MHHLNPVYQNFRVRVRVSHIPRSSQPATNLMTVVENMAQRCDSMVDSFHLANFPHMTLVNSAALANDSDYAFSKSSTQMYFSFIVL